MERVDSFSNYEKLKGNLYPRLCSRQGNDDLISRKLSFPYGDLVIMVTILFPGMGAVTIDDDMLKNWKGISPAKVLRDALGNLEKIETSSVEIAKNHGDMDLARTLNDCPEADGIVLTNRCNMLGASEMLAIRKKALIVPSSVDEVILYDMPEYETEGDLRWILDDIRQLVIMVNSTLSREMVLSDNVYYCDGENIFSYDGMEINRLPDIDEVISAAEGKTALEIAEIFNETAAFAEAVAGVDDYESMGYVIYAEDHEPLTEEQKEILRKYGDESAGTVEIFCGSAAEYCKCCNLANRR